MLVCNEVLNYYSYCRYLKTRVRSWLQGGHMFTLLVWSTSETLMKALLTVLINTE